MAGFVGTRSRGGLLAPRGEAGPKTAGRRTRPTGGARPGERDAGEARSGRGGAEARRALDLPRRSVRGVVAIRSQRRQARVGYVMIAIVVAFLLGLFSLSQTVRVSAIDYDLGALVDARTQLEATQRELKADLARLGGEPVVRRRALDAGLVPLVEPVVVPAH